ncbi:MAG: glutamine-hydrolyzing carbamoyl-phosphate synthase small subunit [Solirubrobacterales bacterium]|nr:glutamine-hydrolyzing carbamoyl-phosphate synthase small subunit [Solirubrobacterales bacterium]
MSPATAGPKRQPGFVLLEDGTRFDGELIGSGSGVGEVVFNTAMSGYQEEVSDPSYAGQIIVFTYPEIGNYGVSSKAMESARAHARGVIMRDGVNYSDQATAEGGWLDWLEEAGVWAIDGIDTRGLVRHIRDRGAMRGGIFPADLTPDEARSAIEAEASMTGRDLTGEVTPERPVMIEGSGIHVVALDTGIKNSIIRRFRNRDCRITLLPCTTDAEGVLAHDPDLIFLANGPGDPAATTQVTETAVALLGRKPIAGICFGHQLLSRAIGLETFKLPFGHRGGNHPVKDLEGDLIEITSQNHGFSVVAPDGSRTVGSDRPLVWESEYGEAAITHVNLYDNTIEGLRLPEAKAISVQYHPEAGPGPRDSIHMFDRFLAMVEAG